MTPKKDMKGIDLIQSISQNIRKFREKLGLTQLELAEKCGWEEGNVRISNYECGTREPVISDIRIIAKALQCTISELLGEPSVKEIGAFPILLDSEIEKWVKNGILPELQKYGKAIMDGLFSKETFIYKVCGDSMVSATDPRRSLNPGDHVFIDPRIEPYAGCLVMVCIDQVDFKIRIYQRDGIDITLKALNTDSKPLILDKTMEIVGVLFRKDSNLLP